MKKFFIFLSALLIAGCGVQRMAQTMPEPEMRVWDERNLHTEGINSYRVNFGFGSSGISGVMMVSLKDGVYRGSVFNEFGIKGFDFICSPSKSEVRSVAAFINKWYIRKTIASDLQFLFCIDTPEFRRAAGAEREGGREVAVRSKSGDLVIVRKENGDVVMENRKRGIKYNLSVM